MAANPINQNILKAGSGSESVGGEGVRPLELHPFNKLSPEAAEQRRFKEFSRERSKLRRENGYSREEYPPPFEVIV